MPVVKGWVQCSPKVLKVMNMKLLMPQDVE